MGMRGIIFSKKGKHEDWIYPGMKFLDTNNYEGIYREFTIYEKLPGFPVNIIRTIVDHMQPNFDVWVQMIVKVRLLPTLRGSDQIKSINIEIQPNFDV